jgi:hypothetical protein
MRITIVALAGLMAMSNVARAQTRPRSDSLPRDLVTALLGGSMGAPAIDVVSGFADSLLPASMFRDAQVLGYGDLRSSVMTVAYFPYAPQATVDTIRARLIAAGWKAPTQDTARGFVNSYGSMYSQGVCSSTSVVYPTVRVRNLSRTLAVISRQHSPEFVAMLCGDSSGARNASTTVDRLLERRLANPAAGTPLPRLEPPLGMDSRGGGTTGSPSRDRAMEMSASLIGSLPLTDIAAHYARLFTEAGWRKVEELIAKSIAIQTFEIIANNERWHCAFSVTVPAPDAADVRLSLRRL